ncbi:MAG: hypothetical protein ACKKL6_04070 [Candidatus Komeilibacteria bacterium]
MGALEKVIKNTDLNPGQLVAIIKSTGTTATKEMAARKLNDFLAVCDLDGLINFYEWADDYDIHNHIVTKLSERWSTVDSGRVIKICKAHNKEFIWESVFESKKMSSWLKARSRKYLFDLGTFIKSDTIWLCLFELNRLSFAQMVEAIQQAGWKKYLINNLVEKQLPSRHEEMTTPKLINLAAQIQDDSGSFWKFVINSKRLSVSQLIEIIQLAPAPLFDEIIFALSNDLKKVPTERLKLWVQQIILISKRAGKLLQLIVETGKLPKDNVIALFNQYIDRNERDLIRACLYTWKLDIKQITLMAKNGYIDTISVVIGNGLIDQKLKRSSLDNLLELVNTFSLYRSATKALEKMSTYLLPKLQNKTLDQLMNIGSQTYIWPILIDLIKSHLVGMSKDELITIGCEADNDYVWGVIYDQIKLIELSDDQFKIMNG